MTIPLFHPRRELGRTGFVATVLGIGDLADRQLPLAQLVATVREPLTLALTSLTPLPATRTATASRLWDRQSKDTVTMYL